MDIQVELVDISTVKKKLTVQVPAEAAQKKFNEIADDYRKRLRLPGFRPGRAPLELIKRRYHKDIRGDLLQQLVPDSYEEALREKGLLPLSEPRLENLSYEEGQPLSYDAYFETRPQITVPDYKGLKVKAERPAVTDEDIDKQIERLRQEHARLVPVEDRPIQAGDFAMVDLHGEYVVEEGKPHAHPHKPIERENMTVEVGAEETHKAFTEALLGMNIAQEKTVDVEYPDDYPEKNLAGHAVRFTVEVADIKRKELPEVNDEFAKELGMANMAELKAKVRADLEELRERNRKEEIRRELLEKLASAAPFEVPDALAEDRIDDRIRDLTYNIAARGVDPTKVELDWPKVRSDLRPQAEKDVRAAMILGEVAKIENLQVSDGEVEDELARMAGAAGQPKEKVRQHFLKENRLADLRAQIQRNKALDFVYDHAELEE